MKERKRIMSNSVFWGCLVGFICFAVTVGFGIFMAFLMIDAAFVFLTVPFGFLCGVVGNWLSEYYEEFIE